MTHAWVVLTGPNGRDVSAPTEAQRASALAQVYRGGPGIDDEPPSAVLRFGYDDGLMYEIE